MKRLIFFFSMAAWPIFMIQAAPVDSLIAKQIAHNFVRQKLEKSSSQREVSLQIVHNSGYENLYIFNNGQDDGFVIIAADDRSLPVLGYAEYGTLVPDSMPANFAGWLTNYEQEISWLKTNVMCQDTSTAKEWQAALAGGAPLMRNDRSVTPLIQTQWDQNAPYNYYCPYNSLTDQRCPTGCVATAMAQIMKYWEWPIQGNGAHSYDDWFYGTLSANFENSYYAWWDMPNSVSSNSDNLSIAHLMYDCGVSIDMDYGFNGSSAFSTNVASALTRYFSYASNVRYVEKADYSTADWRTLLKNEINCRRPIIYRGEDNQSNSAHCFVCDGYDDNNYFHFNWGWSGYADGYFLLTSLTPAGYNFTNGQCAVIGIQPPSWHGGYDLILEDYLSVSKSALDCGETFSLTAAVTNRGSRTFANDLVVVAYEAANTENYTVLKTKSVQLRGGYYSTYTFSNLQLPQQGVYYLQVLYTNDQNSYYYSVADQGSYTNSIAVTCNCSAGDQYEANNTYSDAYVLGRCTTDSKTYTINANFHTGTDRDYYQIELPTNHNYSVTATLFSSANSDIQTANAHYSFRQNSGGWSNYYTIHMPAQTVINGGRIYFYVCPINFGQMGTYKLRITVQK